MKRCSVPGCNNKYLARGYCSRHHQQIIMGKAPFNPGRCVTDGNDVQTRGVVGYVETYDKKGDVCGVAVIDSCYVQLIAGYRWHNSDGYAVSSCGRTMQGLVYCVAPSGFVVDHINRDRMDNRIANLRLVSYGINNSNRSQCKDNTSGYIGVSFDKSRGQYTAYFRSGGKRRLFKRFSCPVEAARYRDAVAKEYLGSIAVLNFPESSHDRYPI